MTTDQLVTRLRAFAVDCVTHGDMTPVARIMLDRILDEATERNVIGRGANDGM
jgi:hypothetical protein